jgi:predicted TIM-barrel fold metal-dependent hydrolase
MNILGSSGQKKSFLIAALMMATSIFILIPMGLTESKDIPIFDAHNQMDEGLKTEEIISLLDAAGVQRTFFAARYPWHDTFVLEAAERYPKRILPIIRTKGDERFESNEGLLKQHLAESVKDPRYFGMAELLVFHAFKPRLNERERKIFLNDKKVNLIIDFLQNKNWPLILHMEMASAGVSRQTYMVQLERFLNDHPNLPVVMIHMAQLDTPDVERLIQAHPNLYFMTGHVGYLTSVSDNGKDKFGRQPWTPIFMDGELLDPWRDLFIRYPDKFVYASDAMIVDQWRTIYVKHVHTWRHAFRELPPEVAHKIAHQNAERLWHLEAYRAN